MNIRPTYLLLAAAFLLSPSLSFSQTAPAAASQPEAILKPAEVSPKLLPDRVFFRGQSAPVQQRNTAGVRYADGYFVLAGLVDNSGYSTAIREKYQAYLITEVPVVISGQTLKPGAYGIGFLEANKFLVMDLGANEVLSGTSVKDAEIKRPVPLQIVAGTGSGNYRLYHGREYVEFQRAK